MNKEKVIDKFLDVAEWALEDAETLDRDALKERVGDVLATVRLIRRLRLETRTEEKQDDRKKTWEPKAGKAIKELREGLACANADFDPQWHGMGRYAMLAMAKYPPWLDAKSEMDEDDIEFRGDRIRLELAATPQFEAFLTEFVLADELTNS